MNRDDLLAHVTASIAGWMNSPPRGTEQFSAFQVHQKLLHLAGIHPRRKIGGTLSNQEKQVLISTINETSAYCIDLGLGAIATVEKIGCDYFSAFEDINGEFQEMTSRFSSQVPLLITREILQLTSRLRTIHAKQQAAVLDALEVWLSWKGAAVYVDFAGNEMTDPAQRNEWISSEAEELKTLTKCQAELDNEGKRLMDEIVRTGLEYWNVTAPIAVPDRATRDELMMVAKLYSTFSNYMCFNEQLDPSASEKMRDETEAALKMFNDIGKCFRVLSTWLRSLTMSGDDQNRLCKHCYRYLKSGAKKFCPLHKRIQEHRQPASVLYLSKAYNRRWNLFLAEIPNFSSYVTGQIFWRAKPSEGMQAAAENWIQENDIQAAALSLAALLRPLYPLVAPVIQDSISRHFVDMVLAVKVPYGIKLDSLNNIEKHKLSIIKRSAINFLSWDNFFFTFYGSPENATAECDKFDIPRYLWKGHDDQHPLARGGLVPMRQIPLDISRLRCWEEEKALFGDYAYFSPERARQLREQLPRPGSKRMSFAAIGRELGVSGEAVRKALLKLKPDNDLTGKGSTRKRIHSNTRKTLDNHDQIIL